MSATSNPVINSQLIAATATTGPNPFRILLTGQTGVTTIGATYGNGTGGTAVSQTPYKEVQTLTNSQITGYFGTNSELTNRIFRTLTNLNGLVSVWVVPLSSALYATNATFSMPITGTATQAGTINLQLVDAYNYSIAVTVNIGDTASVVAGNIGTAISQLSSIMPFQTTVSGGTITFTATDPGTLGNKYTIGFTGTIPAGLTVPVGQFSGGTIDPSNTNIFTNVSSTRFHAISWPWQTNYTTLNSFLTARNVISNAFLQGIGYIGYDDTETNIHNALNGTSVVNSQNLVFMGNQQISGVSQIITPPDLRVAEFISILALRMTAGAPISQYIASTATSDQTGGPGLASLPLFNTPLQYTQVANSSNLFTGVQQASNIVDGYTTIGVNANGSSAIMGQVVTTYKTNTAGVVDPSFHYLEYVITGYTSLEIIYNQQKSDFAVSRLSGGNLIPNVSMANQQSIQNELLSIYNTLSNTYPLLAAGKAGVQLFLNNLNIVLNFSTGTVTESGILPLVTQLRTINQTFQINYQL